MTRDSFGLKAENKLDLQREFGLTRNEGAFLLGYVGRLVEQKGVDLILAILPRLLTDPNIQFVIQGSGERRLEQALQALAARAPAQVGVVLRLRRGPRPPHRGRLRRLPDALALRALRAQPDSTACATAPRPSSTAPAGWRTP